MNGMVRALCFVVSFCVASEVSQAFQFTPIADTIKLPKRQIYFSVVNEGPEPIAVEITPKVRNMDAQGNDILSEIVDDEVAVYPDQLVVPPRSTKKVSVQWLGSELPKTELSYRLIAEQMPVNLENVKGKKGAQIQVMLRYIASLYVRDEAMKSNLVVLGISRVSKGGKSFLKVEVANKGTRHTLVERPKLSVGEVVLEEKQLQGLANSNILAGATCTFEVPFPKVLEGKNLSGQGASEAVLKYSESY